MGGTMSLSPLVPRIQMCERCRGIAIWGLWLKTRCFFWACLQPGCLDQDRLPNAEAVPLGGLPTETRPPLFQKPFHERPQKCDFPKERTIGRGTRTQLFLFCAVKYLETLRRGGRQALVSRLARGVLKVSGSTRPGSCRHRAGTGRAPPRGGVCSRRPGPFIRPGVTVFWGRGTWSDAAVVTVSQPHLRRS